MTFHDPLALVLLFPLLLIFIIQSRKSANAILFSAVADLSALPKTLRQRSAQILPWMSAMALTLAVIALARPQVVNMETTVISKGVDIVLAIDLSTSMLAVDRGGGTRNASRLTIAKKVAGEFINQRTDDRIGVVAFAARPYPVAPLTLDHDWLATVLDRLEIGNIEDGTALGDGILAAVNRLRSSRAGSRTVVLMTDGRSNVGEISPGAAASVARALGIRVYTIGIGAKTPALFPVTNPLGGIVWREVNADLDEAALREIAAITGGRSFRANDASGLRSVFQEIDRLEKRPIEEKQRRNVHELFTPLLIAALLLVMFSLTLRATWLRGFF